MKINIWHIVIGAIVLFAILKQCESEPRVITKTVTKIEIVHDTIQTVKIQEKEKKVYVEKIITKEGKEVIVYQDKPSENNVTASQFEVEILSNDATAKLLITSETKPLDIQGVITYPKETITNTTKIIKDKSGLYLYGQLPITDLQNPEIGALMQIRNKMFISGGVQYNNFTKQLDVNIGLGIKIW